MKVCEYRGQNKQMAPFSVEGGKKEVFFLMKNVYLLDVCHIESIMLDFSSASVPIYKLILRLFVTTEGCFTFLKQERSDTRRVVSS